MLMMIVSLLSELGGAPASLVTQDIGSLSLKDPPHPVTTGGDPSVRPTSAVLEEAVKRLASIRNVYLKLFEDGGVGTTEGLLRSRCVYLIAAKWRLASALVMSCG